jgi:hypothetical protein
MVLVSYSRRAWAISMAVSVVIFAVLYFTVIKPSSDTANQAVKTGLQQTQQALSQAQQQLSTGAGQVGRSSTSGGTVSTAPAGSASTGAGQVEQQLSKAQQLTACVTAAGTDVGQIEACKTKFGQ